MENIYTISLFETVNYQTHFLFFCTKDNINKLLEEYLQLVSTAFAFYKEEEKYTQAGIARDKVLTPIINYYHVHSYEEFTSKEQFIKEDLLTHIDIIPLNRVHLLSVTDGD